MFFITSDNEIRKKMVTHAHGQSSKSCQVQGELGYRSKKTVIAITEESIGCPRRKRVKRPRLVYGWTHHAEKLVIMIVTVKI